MESIRIAKELLKIAKSVLSARFTDPSGIDTGTVDEGNSNRCADLTYEEILRKLYSKTPQVSDTIIDMGRLLDRETIKHQGLLGTMTNGNMYFKYNIHTQRKLLIIMAFVSKEGKIKRSDLPDIKNLFKFLKDHVEDGYVISTDCNTHSIPFLATFALLNGYYFHAGEARMEFGDTGDDRDISRECVCCKEDIGLGENNARQFAMKNGELLYKYISESKE